jgi:hypothetical protein
MLTGYRVSQLSEPFSGAGAGIEKSGEMERLHYRPCRVAQRTVMKSESGRSISARAAGSIWALEGAAWGQA